MDAVAARFGAEIDDRVTDACGFGVKNLVGFGDADRHRIDEDVAVIARVETHLSANRRHAEGIAIAANARNNARHEMARFGVIGRAEAQRVERRNRARAHGEHIAQNTANSGRRTLIGLDIGRVVVALHFEDAGQTIADIDDARIFAGALNNPRRFGGQAAQMQARGFIRAVLVPHGREDAELGQRWLATNQRKDPLIFVGLQAVLGDEFGCHGNGVFHQAAPRRVERLSNNPRPSVPPTSVSIRFSGWGIMPSTLRCSE